MTSAATKQNKTNQIKPNRTNSPSPKTRQHLSRPGDLIETVGLDAAAASEAKPLTRLVGINSTFSDLAPGLALTKREPAKRESRPKRSQPLGLLVILLARPSLGGAADQ